MSVLPLEYYNALKLENKTSIRLYKISVILHVDSKSSIMGALGSSDLPTEVNEKHEVRNPIVSAFTPKPKCMDIPSTFMFSRREIMETEDL